MPEALRSDIVAALGSPRPCPAPLHQPQFPQDTLKKKSPQRKSYFKPKQLKFAGTSRLFKGMEEAYKANIASVMYADTIKAGENLLVQGDKNV